MAVRTVPSGDGGQPQVPIQVPKLVTDPVASFKPWPINIRVGSETVCIPALPASEWLDVLMRSDDMLFSDDVFPGMLPDDDRITVLDAYFDQKIAPEEMEKIALRVISSAAGRPWWVALRVISVLRQNWDVLGGEFILSGVNPAALSLAGWIDAAIVLICRGIGDNVKINQFYIRLEKPPQGEEVEEPTVEANAFLAMM